MVYNMLLLLSVAYVTIFVLDLMNKKEIYMTLSPSALKTILEVALQTFIRVVLPM